jgi:hypothetical protein
MAINVFSSRTTLIRRATTSRWPRSLIAVNPAIGERVVIKKHIIERRDGRGFLEILPAQDVAGSHGKTARFIGWDEIHAYKTWDIIEALQPDPTRRDSLQWVTSYASIYHRPGIPLFDLMQQGRTGRDPRMFFSWYAADYCTDPSFAELTPEQRANPSMASWADPNYLVQQQARLPAHKYRRLHLNLPGLPEGSAFQPEPIMDAIERGVSSRPPEPGIVYKAFVDMSGGSSDDAVLAIAHRDADGSAILDLVLNQGPQPPFDPRKAITRFASVLRDYRVTKTVGDRYAGETFRAAFRDEGIEYTVSERTASQLYESIEPVLNGHRVTLLDVPILEQQLLGLMWKGGKITHQTGEHDDWANASAGAVALVVAIERPPLMIYSCNAMSTLVPRPDGPRPDGSVHAPKISAFLLGD